MMKKVLKFVKGKRDEKKDYASSNIGFNSNDQYAKQPVTRPTEEASTTIEHACGYSVDVNGKDKSLTKLHKVTWQGNLEKVKAAIKKTDIDIRDRSNRTALHLAAARGHANVVYFLVNNKANVNIRDSDGKVPLLKAVESGSNETVRILLENQVDLNPVDNGGNSALHITAKKGFYDISSMLLEKGVNIEVSNHVGEFPLHLATQAEHNELVELFLRYGASVNVVDSNNRSPLMLAAKNGNMTLVRLFLDYGAQRCLKDKNNMTAEDYAALEGYHEMAVELKKSATHNTLSPYGITGEASKNIQRITERSASLEPLSRLSATELKRSPSLKLRELVQQSDDEISEESGKDIRATERREEDSPRSCIIPPPCKPPRSWDFIQSGVMDDHNRQEPRRRSLLTLGSLRSKKNSFSDSPDGGQRKEVTGEPWISSQKPNKQEGTESGDHHQVTQKSNDIFSNKQDIDEGKKAAINNPLELGSNFCNSLQHYTDDAKKSDSESDWDSDGSLPLGSCMATTSKEPAVKVTTSQEDNADERALNLRRKAGNLMRSESIDLSDDTDHAREILVENTSSNGTQQLIHLNQDIYKDEKVAFQNRKSCKNDEGTLGREGTLMGYEEIWESNPHLPLSTAESSVLNSCFNVQKTVSMKKDSSDSTEVSEGIYRGAVLQDINENKALSWNTHAMMSVSAVQQETNEDTLLFRSPCLDQRGKKLNSSEAGLCHLKMTEVPDIQSSLFPKVKMYHSKSESCSMDGLNGKVSSHEALKEIKMAHWKRHSHHQSISVPPWNKSEETHQKISDPNTETIADNGHIKAQLKCYDEALQELAQAPFIKKQTSLPLPHRNEAWDPIFSQFAGTRGHHYLSLPRTNELIDEAFKEIGKSSVKLKQGSLSLPRTATSKDMISDAYPTLTHPSKKFSQKRRRTESEGEVSSAPTKESEKIQGISGIKYEKLKGSSDSSLPTHFNILGNVTKDDHCSYETQHSDNVVSSSRESLPEKPLRKKRGILMAMRCLMGRRYDSMNGSIVRNMTVEETVGETVSAANTNSQNWLQNEETTREMSNLDDSTVMCTNKEVIETGDLVITMDKVQSPSLNRESHVDIENNSIISDINRKETELRDSTAPEILPKHQAVESQSLTVTDEQPCKSSIATGHSEAQVICDSRKDCPSDGDSEHSQLDTTPQHMCATDIPTNHHTVLKKHLQTATFERGQLQQTAAELEERAERLRYELADAHEAAKSQDEVVVLLQKQLTYMESVHACCLEDAQHHQLRIANLEQELTHLQDLCQKQEEEKLKLQELIVNKKDNENEEQNKVQMKDEEQELLSASDNHCNTYVITIAEKEKLESEVKLLEEANVELSQRLSEINEKYLKLLEENAQLSTKTETESDSKKNFPSEATTVYVYGPQEFKIVIKSEFDNLFNLKDQFKILAEKFINISSIGAEIIQEDLKRAIDTLISSCENVESILSKYSLIFRDEKDCGESMIIDTEEICSKEREKICLNGRKDLIFETNDLGDREMQIQQNTETLKNEFVAHLIELKTLIEIHDSEIYNILQQLINSAESRETLKELISNLEGVKRKSSALCLQVECVIDLLHMNNENLLNLFVNDSGVRGKYYLKESCNSLEIQVCSEQSTHEVDKDMKVSPDSNFSVTETVISQNELSKNNSFITNDGIKEGVKVIECLGEMDGNEEKCVPSDMLLNIFKENLHLTQLAVTKQLLTRQLPEYNVDSVPQYSPVINDEKSLNDIIAENASLKCELQKAKFEFEELEKELKEMMLQKCVQPLVTEINEKEKLQNVTFSPKKLKSDKVKGGDEDLSPSENVKTFSVQMITDSTDVQKKPYTLHDTCVIPESTFITVIDNDIPVQQLEGCHHQNDVLDANEPEMIEQTVYKSTFCETPTLEINFEAQISKLSPHLLSKETTIIGVVHEECSKSCDYSQPFEVTDSENMKLQEQISFVGEEISVKSINSKQTVTGNSIFNNNNQMVDGSDCTQLSNLNGIETYHSKDLLLPEKLEECNNEHSNYVCSSKKAEDVETNTNLSSKGIETVNFNDTVKYHYNCIPILPSGSDDEKSNSISASKKVVDLEINESTSKGIGIVNFNDAVKYHYSDIPVQTKHEESDSENLNSISSSKQAAAEEINVISACKDLETTNTEKFCCKHSNNNGMENNESQFCIKNEQKCQVAANYCSSPLFAEDHSYPETNIDGARNCSTSHYDISECTDIVENDLFKISQNPKECNSVWLGIAENDNRSNQNTIASACCHRGFENGADDMCGDKASHCNLNTGNKGLCFPANASGNKSARKKVVNGTNNTKTESGLTTEMTAYHKSGSYCKPASKQQGIFLSRNSKFSDREVGRRNVHFYHKFSKMGVDGSDSLETSTTGGSSDTESEYPAKNCNFKSKNPVLEQENDCGSIDSPSSDSTLCHEDTETEESCGKNENFKFPTAKVRRGTPTNNKTLERGNYTSKFTTISEDFTKPYQKCYLKEHHQAEMKEKSTLNYSSSETCSSSSVSRGKQCHTNSKRDLYSGRQSRIPTYIKPFGRRSSTNSANVNNQCSKTDNSNYLLKLNKTFSERNISEYTKDSNFGNKMKCNKNAPKNASAGGNSDLQSELQTEREKVRKHAVSIRRLKSELQLMKNSMAENKRPMLLGHNSHVTRQRNSSVSAPHSPHHYSFTAAEFQKQVNELEQKVNEEHALRFSLEVQVNKMRYELQEKFNIEKELMLLQNKLENDFVSKTEMDAVKRNYEAALAKARQDAELSVYDELRNKLHQINIFIEKQAQEQANITHLQNINERQVQQEFKEISLKILSDFAKVQATLQEKDEKEKELKDKYEKLIKECEKEQEVQRKKLIEKSYSVNLTPYMNKKVKDVNSKSCMLDISSSQRSASLQSLCARHSSPPVVAVPHSSNNPWVQDNALNYILHRDLEDSITKNSSSDDAAIPSSTNKPLSPREKQLEVLRMKYFVY